MKLTQKLRDELVSYIYEEVANKSLTNGCKVVVVTRTESKGVKLLGAPQYRYSRKSVGVGGYRTTQGTDYIINPIQ